MKNSASLLATATAVACTLSHAAPVELATFRGLTRPPPSQVIQYGASASQAIDLFLPAGPGPHPLAVLLHGGCWSVHTAGREQLRHLGDMLAAKGIAVWSIGYRRADEPGGGYPGTFQDVGQAIDRAASDAARYQFDLSRSVLVGHSAGGHLALWAAARDQLPQGSPLYRANPFVPLAVISLAGVGDLRSFSRFVPLLCGPGVMENLVPASASIDPYSEISPAAMQPARARVTMVSGVLDRLVPPYVAYDYALAMERKHAPRPELIDIPGAGHFDLVTPGTRAWKEIHYRIAHAVGIEP
jgi:acetyl esterase/lipase